MDARRSLGASASLAGSHRDAPERPPAGVRAPSGGCAVSAPSCIAIARGTSDWPESRAFWTCGAVHDQEGSRVREQPGSNPAVATPLRYIRSSSRCRHPLARRRRPIRAISGRFNCPPEWLFASWRAFHKIFWPGCARVAERRINRAEARCRFLNPGFARVAGSRCVYQCLCADRLPFPFASLASARAG